MHVGMIAEIITLWHEWVHYDVSRQPFQFCTLCNLKHPNRSIIKEVTAIFINWLSMIERCAQQYPLPTLITANIIKIVQIMHLMTLYHHDKNLWPWRVKYSQQHQIPLFTSCFHYSNLHFGTFIIILYAVNLMVMECSQYVGRHQGVARNDSSSWSCYLCSVTLYITTHFLNLKHAKLYCMSIIKYILLQQVYIVYTNKRGIW